MHIDDSRMTCEEYGDYGYSAVNWLTRKRMWTSSTTTPTIALSKVKDGTSQTKDGISNLNKVITKVTTKVRITIIIIFHL
jgi:hypothetical protein